MPILQYANEIQNACLLIYGEKAHSLYFIQEAFEKLEGDNKEIFIILNANHTDLYDRKDIIPFDKIQKLFERNM